MSSVEGQIQYPVDHKSQLTSIPISDLALILWHERRWLARVIVAGLVLATLIAFLIPDEYQSTAQLMPPDQQTFQRTSVLNYLSGASLMLPSAGGGLLSTRTPTDTAIGVLGSQTVQDDIINRLDLRKAYHLKLYLDTRKTLTERSSFTEDKKSGIITITVLDRDRNRAQKIAELYIEDLNALVNSLSTSAARRERVFLEGRLKSIKIDLDNSSRALSQFSSRNATVDPQRQGEATVEAAGRLQGQLIAAQSQLSGLKAIYSNDSARVQQFSREVEVLQGELRKMSGVGESVNGADLKTEQFLPSVRELPILGYTYYDLFRQVTIQETLYETLTKQYELAKVQEAQEIPSIKVLDAPDVPEKKASPHRLAIILAGTWLSLLVGVLWIIVLSYRRKSTGVQP